MPASEFYYVYILVSIEHPDHHYTGCTTDLSTRLAKHNAGGSPTHRKAPAVADRERHQLPVERKGPGL